jgi:hypothetical protein
VGQNDIIDDKYRGSIMLRKQLSWLQTNLVGVAVVTGLTTICVEVGNTILWLLERFDMAAAVEVGLLVPEIVGVVVELVLVTIVPPTVSVD